MGTPAPLPFADGQASGVEELAGASPAAINVTHEPGNVLRTRPGLTTWALFPATPPDASPVIGIWIFGTYVVYVTQDRKLWALTSPGYVSALSDATAVTQLDGTGRPVAVVTRTRIVIIGGGVPQKWEGVGLSARLGGSPPSGNSITALKERLVISDSSDTGIFFWSEPGEFGSPSGHETWLGDMNSAEAEARPDVIRALGSTADELFVIGSETTQAFLPDDNVIFTPAPTAECGTLASGSVIKWDAAYAFLDDRRRIVSTDGRSFTDLSGPGLARTLYRFATVADCWAFRARFDGVDLLGFVFPTEGRTLVYNSAVQKWSEWRSLDSNGNWQPWAGRSHCYWPDRAIHLVGRDDGTIALLDPTVFTDAGTQLKALVRTGFGDRGLGNRKLCERVQFTVRRGSSTATTAPFAELRWRDNLGAFGAPLRFSLGNNGDYEAQVSQWTLGVYNTRQWELSVSDVTEFVLVGAEEMFTPLEA